MHLERVTDINHFYGLREEWNRLYQSNQQPHLPLTHEWLHAWWRAFGADRKLDINCVYDDKQLVAIAPFLREQTTYRGIPVCMQTLMANGHSPYCDVIFDNSVTETQKNEIIQLLIRSSDADVLVFNNLPETSIVTNCLLAKNGVKNNRHGIKPSLITPIIYIDGDWEGFIKERSRKFRSSLNNKLNRLNKLSDIAISCEQIASRANPYLNEMVKVSKKSWKRKIKNDLGSNTAGLEFLLQLADAFGPKGDIKLWIMHKAGVPVAYEYHLEYGGVTCPLRADFDEEYRSLSPGSVLEYTVIKSLFDEKRIHEYHSCADDYWYLSNWTDKRENHLTIEIFNNKLKAKSLYFLEYKIIPRLRMLRDKLRKST